MTFEKYNKTTQHPHFAFIQFICVPHKVTATRPHTHIQTHMQRTTRGEKNNLCGKSHLLTFARMIKTKSTFFHFSCIWENKKFPKNTKYPIDDEDGRKQKKKKKMTTTSERFHAENPCRQKCDRSYLRRSDRSQGKWRINHSTTCDTSWRTANGNRYVYSTLFTMCAPRRTQCHYFQLCHICIYFKFQ